MATNPSSSPSVKLLTPTEIGAQLQHLRQLNTLPPSLPTTCVSYNFVDFSPDPAEVDDYGIEGALNHALEVALCPGGRQQGTIIFNERGAGLKFRDLKSTLKLNTEDNEDHELSNSEDEDTFETDDDADPLEPNVVSAESERLVAEDIADLTSPILHDLLSDTPIVHAREAPMTVRTVRTGLKRKLGDADWEI